MDVAPVEDDRIRQPLLKLLEVGGPEWSPLGTDHQAMAVIERVDLILDKLKSTVAYLNWIESASLIHRLGVKRHHTGAARPERFHQHPARRVPHVVRVWLEGKPPNRDLLAGQVAV